MKIRNLFFALIFVSGGCLSPIAAQETTPAPTVTPQKSPEVEIVKTAAPQASPTPAISDEAAAVLPYYNSFMESYLLGPEDVISVEVFAQPNYSKSNITIPPTGRISYPLIKGGISVRGKTVDQIAEEITKKLDEFIIDPQVTVSLDKAVSSRYSVLGDVGRPGVQIMNRRLTLLTAIAEAGGTLATANKKEVVVLRAGADGRPQPLTVNLKQIEEGKTGDLYIQPGDQVIVSGKKIKIWQKLLDVIPVVGFARGILTGGF